MLVQIIAREEIQCNGKMLDDVSLACMSGIKYSKVYEIPRTDNYEEDLTAIAMSFEEECKKLVNPQYDIVERE